MADLSASRSFSNDCLKLLPTTFRHWNYIDRSVLLVYLSPHRRLGTFAVSVMDVCLQDLIMSCDITWAKQHCHRIPCILLLSLPSTPQLPLKKLLLVINYCVSHCQDTHIYLGVFISSACYCDHLPVVVTFHLILRSTCSRSDKMQQTMIRIFQNVEHCFCISAERILILNRSWYNQQAPSIVFSIDICEQPGVNLKVTRKTRTKSLGFAFSKIK